METTSTATISIENFVASKHRCSQDPFWNVFFIAYKKVIDKYEIKMQKMGEVINGLNEKLKKL